MAGTQIRAAAFTHEGAVRPQNEDTVALGDWVQSDPMTAPETFRLALGEPVLALVADGMGGHAAGEIASRAVADYLVSQARRASDAEAVATLLREANAELFAMMRDRPALGGMGTTVAGVALTPAGAIVFNVGDSRVYRVSEGRLEQLSTDDTPGPKLADGRTAAFTSSTITQTLGGGFAHEEIEPHLLVEPLEPGARYLIASDGLTDLVDVAAIEARLAGDDAAAVQALFDAAMARGGRDNVSIVLLRVSPGGG